MSSRNPSTAPPPSVPVGAESEPIDTIHSVHNTRTRACIGRHVGEDIRLVTSKPESQTFEVFLTIPREVFVRSKVLQPLKGTTGPLLIARAEPWEKSGTWLLGLRLLLQFIIGWIMADGAQLWKDSLGRSTGSTNCGPDSCTIR